MCLQSCSHVQEYMQLGSIIILSSRILEDFFVHFKRISLRQLGSNFVYDDDMYSIFIFVFHSGGVIGQTFTSKYSILIYKHRALNGMYVAHITIYCTSECPAACMLHFLLAYIFCLYYVIFMTSFSQSFISFCFIA